MAQLRSNLHISLTPFRNESRVLRETKSLVDMGIVQRVHVLALYEEGVREHETLDGQRSVWRIRLRSRNWPRTLVVQLLKYLELCWRINTYARASRADLVNVHTLALLPLGAWLKFRYGAKLVYDAHELETETEGLTGIRQQLARLVERRLIRFADLVVVVGPKIRDHYVAAYGHPAVVAVLNCPVFRDVRGMKRLRSDLNVSSETKVCLYLGNMSAGRGVEAMLDTFAHADPSERVLALVGYGELTPLVRAYAASSPAIRYLPAVAPDQVLEYAAGADIGLCLIEDTCLSYHFCLPNKLFEYIMAGLPMIVSDLPEMTSIVRESDIGEITERLDAASIRSAIERILRRDQAPLQSALRTAADRFCWEKQEEVMGDAYREHIL